jgi:hypothetical protein
VSAELAPLFVVVGVFGAWLLGRWGFLLVALPVALFHRSLLFMSDHEPKLPPGVQADPQTHIGGGTSGLAAWLAVGFTVLGFVIAYSHEATTGRLGLRKGD